MATFQIPGQSPQDCNEPADCFLDSPELERVPTGMTPAAKVLIVMTGGTICMERSPHGLIPARNFVDRCMAPRPEFNDASDPVPMDVRVQDGDRTLTHQLKSLRTPLSAYGKRIRYVPCSHPSAAVSPASTYYLSVLTLL